MSTCIARWFDEWASDLAWVFAGHWTHGYHTLPRAVEALGGEWARERQRHRPRPRAVAHGLVVRVRDVAAQGRQGGGQSGGGRKHYTEAFMHV